MKRKSKTGTPVDEIMAEQAKVEPKSLRIWRIWV